MLLLKFKVEYGQSLIVWTEGVNFYVWSIQSRILNRKSVIPYEHY